MRDGVTGDFSLRSREEATVSVFDSNFLVGDGIWVSQYSSLYLYSGINKD